MSTSKRALLPGSAASRPSAASPRPPGPPIPPLEVSPSAVLAESAQLVGTFPVTLCSESVIHPRARIDAQAGGVHVGRRCIVHERAVVGAASSSGRVVVAAAMTGVTTLGDYVTVETGATVEAGDDTAVGEGTTVGAGSVVGAGAKVGKVCLLLLCLVAGRGWGADDGIELHAYGVYRHQGWRGGARLYRGLFQRAAADRQTRRRGVEAKGPGEAD